MKQTGKVFEIEYSDKESNVRTRERLADYLRSEGYHVNLNDYAIGCILKKTGHGYIGRIDPTEVSTRKSPDLEETLSRLDLNGEK